MLETPWSTVGNPACALGSLGSSFGPSSLAPVGIHHLLLSNLTTVLARSLVVQRSGGPSQYLPAAQPCSRSTDSTVYRLHLFIPTALPSTPPHIQLTQISRWFVRETTTRDHVDLYIIVDHGFGCVEIFQFLVGWVGCTITKVLKV